MIQIIRNEVFETNSSMTHSLIILTKDQDKIWREENGYICRYVPNYWFKDVPEDERPIKGHLYTEEEALNILKKMGYEYDPKEYDSIDDFINEDRIFESYNSWSNSDYEEYNDYEYTTPGGEDLVIYTKCGRDG